MRPILVIEQDTSNTSTTKYKRYEYDINGNLIFESLYSTGSTASLGVLYSYDSLGRRVKETDNSRSASILRSYLSGSRVHTQDYLGHSTTVSFITYGSLNSNLVSLIQSPEGVTTTLSYNLFDNLTSVSQSGITQTHVYDSYQQLCKVVRPDIGNRAYSFSAQGDLLWFAHGSSVNSSATSCDNTVSNADKVSYSYNYAGLLKTINFLDNSPDKTYTYDNNENIISAKAGGVENTYSYNSADLLENESLKIDGKTFSLSNHYNGLKDLNTITYPDSEQVSLSPNALGQATRVGDYATNAQYYGNGLIKRFNYGNGIVHTSTQYNSGLPKDYYDVKGSTKVVDYYAQYDANSNMTYLRDDQNQLYDLRLGYDDLDRLTTITDSFMGTGKYHYDTMGNIKSYTLGSRNITYHYDNNKRLDRTTGSKVYDFSYDTRGNVKNNGSNSFTFNLAQQVTASSKLGKTSSFVYDGQDKRVKKTVSGETTYFMYSFGGQLLFKESAGINTNHFYLGDRLVAKYGASTEASGRQHYTPYGEPESPEQANNKPSYTGHVYDDDLELVYMQARYYDPYLGRFYSNDPVGYKLENPVMSFNRYLYVNNNPYKYDDPDGEALNFVVKIGVDVGVNVAINLLSGGSANLSGAVTQAIKDSWNPTKTIKNTKKLYTLLKKQNIKGSYVIRFKDGKVYIGKGSIQRAHNSARRRARARGTNIESVDFKQAKNNSDTEAFIDEFKTMKKFGFGKSNGKNLLNKNKSPGEAYNKRKREKEKRKRLRDRQEDGTF